MRSIKPAAVFWAALTTSALGADVDHKLFETSNLVAWCIVPFDAAKRGPEERAKMLEHLGIRKLAYDWRSEHIPTFDEEVLAMKRHGVQITAWWMSPPDLNEAHRKILDVVRRHGLKLQFWTSAADPDPKLPQAGRVKIAAAQIRPLAEEAAKIGCQVGLYNHGGWFGEPENQLAILEQLKLPNVGIVYNLHHGHAHVERFKELLEKMKPYLLALNLNGMTHKGDQVGKKILPISTGEQDLTLLKIIEASGYQGPIGILNHTDLDAEARLSDNLAGLKWLTPQLDGRPPGPRPKMRTHINDAPPHGATPMRAPSSDVALSPAEKAKVVELLAEAKAKGDAAAGAAVFASQKFACVSCHKVDQLGGSIGPELTRVGATLAAEEIAAALLWPKQKVKPEYVAWLTATESGSVHQGYIVEDDAKKLVIRETSTGAVVTIPKGDVVERKQLGTLMPDGLAAAMTPAERRDVVRFLLNLGHDHGAGAHELLAHSHEPTKFEYNHAPLDPSKWTFASHRVNRDRLYDFYAKEADYFRERQPSAKLLPEYPGLDGGKLGHWGNQNEDTWRDGRWNQTDCGTLQSGIFRVGKLVVPRGVCVRLGDKGQMAVCFNPQKLSYEAAWEGGFVKFSNVRHGFMDGLEINGRAIPLEASASQAPIDSFKDTPAGNRRYRGFYRYGPRVAFRYDLGDKVYLDEPSVAGERFVRKTAPVDDSTMREFLAGGPMQWPQVLETRGITSTKGPYAIDRIAAPMKNPWNALMFFGGHDFLPDGSAMVCTIQGDVWHVTGLDAKLDRVRWKRYAAGLNQPLGLVVADRKVFVLGRDQITRLHDLNGDDEADFYECFSNAYVTSIAGHDFICGLERDRQGAFYTSSGNQGLLRISPDGQRADVLATGFRNPDGLGLSPNGEITVPVSEGEWTATSMICLVPPRPCKLPIEVPKTPWHYGYRGPIGGRPPELPLVFLPRGVDNSAGGQTVVNSSKWGPLEGQWLHLSFGAGAFALVLRDQVGEVAQGAVVPMDGDFASGAHRGRFNPVDGQLYVTGCAGWGSYTPDDGSFERVRYTGDPVQLPIGFHVHQNGVRLRFSSPIDPTVAGRAEQQFAQAWNYRYGPAYGSPEFAPSHPSTPGHDRLAVTGSHVLSDGSLFVEIPDLQPVNQLHLRLRVNKGAAQDVFATVHALDSPFTGFAGYKPHSKIIAAHPLLANLALLAKPPEPNPWRGAIADARAITIESGPNLSFATRSFTVRAGEPIQLTFSNPDVVPHNWVLIKPNSLERVGELVNRLVADPEAARRQYIPKTDDVLFYIDITPAGQQFSIYFRAPTKPGRYPYLCSFPGHWMVMNGQMVVQ